MNPKPPALPQQEETAIKSRFESTCRHCSKPIKCRVIPGEWWHIDTSNAFCVNGTYGFVAEPISTPLLGQDEPAVPLIRYDAVVKIDPETYVAGAVYHPSEDGAVVWYARYEEISAELTQAVTSLAAANRRMSTLFKVIESRTNAMNASEKRAELAESKLSEAQQTIEKLESEKAAK